MRKLYTFMASRPGPKIVPSVIKRIKTREMGVYTRAMYTTLFECIRQGCGRDV